MRLDPRSADALVNLGVVQRRQGDLVEAVQSYRRAIEINPGSTSAYQNLAVLHFSEGRVDKALEILEWVEENLPGDPYPLLSLGDLYL